MAIIRSSMSEIGGANNIEDSASSSVYAAHQAVNYRIPDRSAYDGMVDNLGEVRLRIALIENPEIQRSDYINLDASDVQGVYNLNTGKVALSWADLPGGVIRPAEVDGQWKYDQKEDKYNPEERTFNDWDIQSRREMVDLTHPFIWADNKNWCGYNYIPPVGSKVVVGFRKHGFPIILGYLPTHYKICYPVLKPGETCNKGYGNNYIHNRWSDKLDLKAWSVAGDVDKDDPSKSKVNASDCTLWIRMDANNRHIKISATDASPAHTSVIYLKPESITMTTVDLADENASGGTTSYFQDSNNVTITTKTFTVNADLVDINSTRINQN